MAQLRIPCPHCQAVTAIEEEKLPDKPVTFACPHCKGKVSVDKAKLLGTTPGAPAHESAPAEPVEAEELPPGATIPSGLILGEDPAAIGQLRELLGRHGSKLDLFSSAEDARNQMLLDPPLIVVYVANALTAPPYGPIQPLTSIPPSERRRIFFMLVADGVRTLDGNAAFMYQVNLCLNKADLAVGATTLYSALEHHRRLYRAYFAAVESL
jgi:hypothetical protein